MKRLRTVLDALGRSLARFENVKLREGVKGRTVLGYVLAGTLACDWVTHENEDFVKWRVARELRKCRPPENAQRLPLPKSRLPVLQPPLVLGFLPTQLAGPSGCGKSTLLTELSQQAVLAQCPVVLLRIRGSPDLRQAMSASDAEACARLETTASQLYNQIGYPSRRSLLHLLVNRASFRSSGVEVHLAAAEDTRDRLASALRLLFAVAQRLFHERLAEGVPPEAAAPVLLFDEVQDLIRDERLAEVGGRLLFHELAVLLVAYCVDRRVVRAAVAGSSALLSVEFDKTVARGARWSHYELHDPPEEAVRKALLARGYAEEDAQAMLHLCGTRLRLLEVPLCRPLPLLDAQSFCEGARAAARGQFADLFRGASPDEASLVARTLDAALDAEISGAAAPMMRKSLTECHVNLASQVLHLRLDRSLTLQSRLHADVWRREGRALAKLART